MTNKEENLKAIIDDIFRLHNPIIDEPRKQQINNFIFSAINDDVPTSHLAINANLGENNRGLGVIIYVLTDLRLIKIDIDAKEIKSVNFPLNTLIGITRTLIYEDIAQFSIAFKRGTFGLGYSKDDEKIADFFQKIDKAWSAVK